MALLIFGLTSGISFFALSDGHGVSQVNDGITRIGWPSLMFEQGGFVWRREFYLKAVLANAAFATFAAVMICLGGTFVRRASATGAK